MLLERHRCQLITNARSDPPHDSQSGRLGHLRNHQPVRTVQAQFITACEIGFAHFLRSEVDDVVEAQPAQQTLRFRRLEHAHERLTHLGSNGGEHVFRQDRLRNVVCQDDARSRRDVATVLSTPSIASRVKYM
jgi:hypothetical protein